MPFRILSIDGGGLKGIIPVMVLKNICEKYLGNQHPTQVFDLFAGTSTGGLIVCALNIMKEDGTPKFTLDGIKNIYENDGNRIFPRRFLIYRYIRSVKAFLIQNKYSRKGLTRVLETHFGNNTISNSIKPIIVPAYDIKNHEPFYFKSIYASASPSGKKDNRNHKFTDICLATSAGPTYFPSYLIYGSTDIHKKEPMGNLIDGGIFMNNPSLAAYLEIKKYKEDPYYMNPDLDDNDIYILSLGTGQFNPFSNTNYEVKRSQVRWAKPLIDLMVSGNSISSDKQTDEYLKPLHQAFNDKYLRINPHIELRHSEMDNSSKKTLAYLKKTADNLFNKEQDKIETFLKSSGLIL